MQDLYKFAWYEYIYIFFFIFLFIVYITENIVYIYA